MKINNRHIGGLLLLSMAALCHYGAYCSWGVDWDEFPVGVGLLFILSWAFIAVFWAAFIVSLFLGWIEFSINIPTPLANYRKTLKARKELNEAITAKYVAMAKAQGAGFDRLHKEVSILEERLEKIEL